MKDKRFIPIDGCLITSETLTEVMQEILDDNTVEAQFAGDASLCFYSPASDTTYFHPDVVERLEKHLGLEIANAFMDEEDGIAYFLTFLARDDRMKIIEEIIG